MACDMCVFSTPFWRESGESVRASAALVGSLCRFCRTCELGRLLYSDVRGDVSSANTSSDQASPRFGAAAS